MSKIHLLLVDDETDFRDSMSRALSRRGFEISPAASGDEAIRLMEKRRPDMVILDLKMEPIDGVTTLNLIRRLDESMPVIILTGNGNFDAALSGVRLRIVDFLQKPIDVDALARKIRLFLFSERGETLRERSVAELMVSVDSYVKIHDDQSIRDLLALFGEPVHPAGGGRTAGRGHGSLLVVDREGRFVRMLRAVEALAPFWAEDLSHLPPDAFVPGMLVAQCKIFGDRSVREAFPSKDAVAIGETTPLMQALALMIRHRAIHLPVLRDGRVIGVLRDRDLLDEVRRLADVTRAEGEAS
ncbi:MAG: response regulator [Myxococcales bacterium]|nr:MAG: response regulator [Myxococcales bacterium]